MRRCVPPSSVTRRYSLSPTTSCSAFRAACMSANQERILSKQLHCHCHGLAGRPATAMQWMPSGLRDEVPAAFALVLVVLLQRSQA